MPFMASLPVPYQESPRRNVLTLLTSFPLVHFTQPTMLIFFHGEELYLMSHYDPTQHVDKAAQVEAAFQRPVPPELHQLVSP